MIVHLSGLCMYSRNSCTNQLLHIHGWSFVVHVVYSSVFGGGGGDGGALGCPVGPTSMAMVVV